MKVKKLLAKPSYSRGMKEGFAAVRKRTVPQGRTNPTSTWTQPDYTSGCLSCGIQPQIWMFDLSHFALPCVAF